jgi:hypothetical protein
MREQQKLAADTDRAGLPNELTSSERDVAMKEFMDVSRQALRMGAREVHLVCLESRKEMPASEEEIEEGFLCVIAKLEFFQHHFAKMGHRNTSCDPHLHPSHQATNAPPPHA